MAFFWPRNTIMFVEGLAVHSADVLRQTPKSSSGCTGCGWHSDAFGSAAAFSGFFGLPHTLAARSPSGGSQPDNGQT